MKRAELEDFKNNQIIINSTNNNEQSIEDPNFRECFLPHWERTLNSIRFAPLNPENIVAFKNLQEIIECTRSILLVDKKSYRILNTPFKKFLNTIRIACKGLLDKYGKLYGNIFLDVLYQKAIPSTDDIETILLKQPNVSQCNFNNQLDTIKIDSGYDADCNHLIPLEIKYLLLTDIIIGDVLSQDIINLDNLVNEKNECMGYMNYNDSDNNKDQGNIMPYLFSYALFLKKSNNESDNENPDQNIMKTRNWIIQFFKKILHIANKDSVMFTDKEHETKYNDIFYIFANENGQAWYVRALGSNLTLFIK
jgi:hypothetical protein